MKYLKGLFVLFAAIMIVTPAAFAQSSGGWQKQDFKVKGTWSIEKRADGNFVVLSDDFKTKNAPDLKIFVSKKSYSDINGKNATDDAAQVAVLKSHKGGQSYKIPASINLNDYRSLIIHCEEYSKLWASTSLK